MSVYQQYGPVHANAAGENGFHFAQTPAAKPGPTKQSPFSFRKRFERIDWKRLGELFVLFVHIYCKLYLC